MVKRIVLLIIISLLYCPLPTISQTKNTNATIKFSFINCPTKSNLKKIIIQSGTNFIIIGDYIIGHNEHGFEIKDYSKGIKSFFNATSNSNGVSIFERKVIPFSSSELFVFKNNTLKQFEHPFGNEIVSMYITNNNSVWIGGDREIAFYKDGKWILLPYPPTKWSISNIFGNDEKQAWAFIESERKIFFFDGKNWTRYFDNHLVHSFLFSDINSGFAIVDNCLYRFQNSKWKFESRSTLLKDIKKLILDTSGNIWGLGFSNFLIRYKNNVWTKYKIYTTEILNDFAFVSDNEGYIVGDNGTIIYFSQNHCDSAFLSHKGFRRINPIPSYSNLDEQYGVAMEDLNEDGDIDIYSVSLYNSNQFYRNTSMNDTINYNILFKEEAFEYNLTGFTNTKPLIKQISKIQHGVQVADIDNDRDHDIYITNLAGKNTMLLNNGKGFFRDVSDQSRRGVGENERTNTATFSDIDNDGDLDLFITNEYSTNRLFINNGYGCFDEITIEAGLSSDGGSICASFADFDNDGLQDLFVTNWGKSNILYKNVSSKAKIKFENISLSSHVSNDVANKSNGIAVGDVNNDGLLDMYITRRGQPNQFFMNQGKFRFKDLTKLYFENTNKLSYGACFADFDNDGFLDLYVSNIGENVLFKNLAGKKFIDVTLQFGAELSGYCTGSATGDLDNDGDIDLYASVFANGSSKLFINQTNNNRFIKLDIAGTVSNFDAIGAKIFLYNSNDSTKLLAYKEILSADSYASHSARQVHFGVDPNYNYTVKIFFPASGILKTIDNVSAGASITVNEEEGVAKFLTLTKQFAFSLLLDFENLIEIIKYFFSLLICLFSFLRCKNKYGWSTFQNVLGQIPFIMLFVILNLSFIHKPLMLSLITPFLFQLTILFVFHLFYERIILTKRINEEKKRTRDQIAKDLHDNVASTLGSGLIYADSLTRNLGAEKSNQLQLAENITSLLHEASESITDLVWSVSPSHSTLQDLTARLRYYFTTNAQNNNIKYNIDISLNRTHLEISEMVKKNIFLIFKEAFHNIIKHSAATEIGFNVYEEGDYIIWILKDNGRGFNKDGVINIDGGEHGNGIANMKKRADEIAGELIIESTLSLGTTILLRTKK